MQAPSADEYPEPCRKPACGLEIAPGKGTYMRLEYRFIVYQALFCGCPKPPYSYSFLNKVEKNMI